jgi:hypothetical protein
MVGNLLLVLLENKEKAKHTEKQRKRRGRTQEKIKDYIVARFHYMF